MVLKCKFDINNQCLKTNKPCTEGRIKRHCKDFEVYNIDNCCKGCEYYIHNVKVFDETDKLLTVHRAYCLHGHKSCELVQCCCTGKRSKSKEYAKEKGYMFVE